MGQGCVAGSGSRLVKRHAPLVAQVPGGARHAVRQGDVNGPGGAIDDRLRDLGALRVRGREEADVLAREIGIEAGDEHGRAHDLGIARGMVLLDLARRRHVRRVELERFGARNERVAGRLSRGGNGGEHQDDGNWQRSCHARSTSEAWTTSTVLIDCAMALARAGPARCRPWHGQESTRKCRRCSRGHVDCLGSPACREPGRRLEPCERTSHGSACAHTRRSRVPQAHRSPCRGSARIQRRAVFSMRLRCAHRWKASAYFAP